MNVSAGIGVIGMSSPMLQEIFAGSLIGNALKFRVHLLANPDKYIAQPTLALSTCPTFVESGVAPRHIDLSNGISTS